MRFSCVNTLWSQCSHVFVMYVVHNARSMTKGVSKPDAKKATKERNTADRPYNADADALVEEAPVKEKKRKAKDADEAVPAEGDKAERKRRKAAAAAAAAEGQEPDAVPEKKKKKRKTEAAEE